MKTFIALVIVFLLIYIGLSVVEGGVTDIVGMEPDGRALQFQIEGKSLHIVFAGNLYAINGEEIIDYISSLFKDRNH